MRTLLICAGVCLTAGTFVVAERVTSSAGQTVALEQKEAVQAALDAFIEESNGKFAADLAAVEDEKAKAQAQVVALNSTVADMTAARGDLEKQVAKAQMAADAVRGTVAELEAANSTLVDRIEVKEAWLANKNAEVAALNSKLEALSGASTMAAKSATEIASLAAELASLKQTLSARDQAIAALEQSLEAPATAVASSAEGEGTEGPDAELIAQVASLNVTLEERDQTIAALQEQIELAEATAAAIDGEGDADTAALVEELKTAMARIEELNEASAAQKAEAEANLATLNATIAERDATVADLQAALEEQEAQAEVVAVAATGEDAEELETLSGQLVELSDLVDAQKETIAHLRMGFGKEDVPMMEMASACIERANKIFEISQIQFATGTSSISEQSTTTLDHLRDLAIGCESDEMFIEIGGHTDSLGAESANQRLSEARAESVRDFLVGRGIPEDTMVAVGFGEAQPIASNDTVAGRALNRRITFTWRMREETPAVEAAAEEVIENEEIIENIDG